MPRQDWFIEQTGHRRRRHPPGTPRAAGHLPAKEPFTMSAQTTSTSTHEPLSSRAGAALGASRARGAAIPKLNDKGRMADIPLSPEAEDHCRAARRDRPDRGQPAPGRQPVRPGRLLRPGHGVPRLRQRPQPAGSGVLRPRRELLARHRRGRLRTPGQDRPAVRDQGRHARPLRPNPQAQQAPDRGGPWRYLEHGPRTAPGGRHPGGQRRRAVGRTRTRTDGSPAAARPSGSRAKPDGETPCATCSPATTGARRRPTGWA